jgi:hypothetical protein
MSAFRQVFGNTTRIRVIEAFSDGIPMTTADCAIEAGVNVKYVYKEIPQLLHLGIIRKYVNESEPRKRIYAWNSSNKLAGMIRKSIISLSFEQISREVMNKKTDSGKSKESPLHSLFNAGKQDWRTDIAVIPK